MLRKNAFVFFLILFLSLTGKIAAQDKSADEVIKIETTLVSVPVIVSDRQGRYVPNLAAKDFTLYDNGAKRDIEFFAATEEPLNVALLIDTSQSTREVLDEIKDSALEFIKLLQPQDRAMIVSFDYQTRVLSALTSDREQLRRAVRQAEIGERFGTTLREAIDETINESFAKIKGRKAIILLTDGKNAGSDISEDELLYALEESDTLVYPVFYQTGRAFNQNNRNQTQFPRGGGRRGGVFGGRFPRGGGQFPPFPRNPNGGGNTRRRERVERKNAEAADILQQIADTTAGRFYRGEVTDLNKTFALIVEELRRQYRLGFYPQDADDDDTTLRELKVQVNRPDITVRARRNYRLQSQSESK
ncbi:MAG: VWA domain-containing protein [Pyrinomonadaceae bacterium]|nr:VWA domain-containing protein [Pyrinomonadaceae bacterium]